MSLWLVGFLFTLGYIGFLTDKGSGWKWFVIMVCAAFLWPMFLGIELGGHLEGPEEERKGGDK